ncbi:MAG: HD domain-containing protein, partial [Spirochaetales bacterium]|nr:HD domain-containing protein [Spirochaetales bacterium]
AQRDSDTNAHNYRVSIYAARIGEEVDLPDQTMRTLIKGSFLHDVGKIGIPDRILRKPGKLDKDEWNIMKTHTTIGANIIGIHNSEIIKTAKVVAATHHERWDGSGYPAGLGGKEIPLISRIVSMADVFDALTSKRPYKSEWPLEKALTEIKKNKGIQFEPAVVDAFLKSIPEILAIKKQYSKVVTVPGKEI